MIRDVAFVAANELSKNMSKEYPLLVKENQIVVTTLLYFESETWCSIHEVSEKI